MTRLPKDRDTHLRSEEIVAEALRQFDRGKNEPSIRSLAGALKVAPSAIYHHFPSRATIIQSAVEQVWNEATARLLELVPEPFEADPARVLVATGIASRRAWLAHYRLAPYMAASPQVNEFTRDALGLMSNLFERLGLKGKRAAAAFHTYGSFMIGSVLFTATRKLANEQLTARHVGGQADVAPDAVPTVGAPMRSAEGTRLSIGEVVAVSTADPARDEELFAQGLQRLVASLVAAG
jgi:AcrR family transcriptional regulator